MAGASGRTPKPSTSTLSKAREFQLVERFSSGYRNREDITTLPPGILVEGSQNVLTNTFQRVGVRQGYTLDGQRDTSVNPILSSFDWTRHTGDERHLRAGFDVANDDGKLQYRYVAAAGDKWDGNTFTADEVYWIDLQTDLSTANYNFCDYWDFTHELKSLLLFVNGSSNIYMWSGAIGTLAAVNNTAGAVAVLNATPTAGGSGYQVGQILTITTGGTNATALITSISPGNAVTSVELLTPGIGYTTGGSKATTVNVGIGTGATLNITTVATGQIKLNGSLTAPQLGFLNTGTYTQQVMINTNTYTYSYVVNEYLVGISPSAAAEPVNSVIQQAVVTFPNSGLTGLPATLQNNLIQNLGNQVYVGGVDNQSIYVSKVNDFQDFTFGSPRAVGDGAILTLDGVPTAMIPQQTEMYVSAGKDQWYTTSFTLSSDNESEALQVTRLKTTTQQAAQSQALTAKIKNNIVFVSFEPILNTLGTAQNYLNDPQVQDISFSIVNDMNDYDFTAGSVGYFQKFVYVCVPKEGLLRIYNMTDDGAIDTNGVVVRNHYWEAPQTISLTSVSIIDGELYGHSYQSSNTFKLFTGYNDDGHPMQAIAAFSFNNSGVRPARKSSNMYYVEGYISSNTVLTLTLQRDMDGAATTASFPINGNDSQIVPQVPDDVSLGKNPLGQNSLGGSAEFTPPGATPPKFRVEKTYNRTPYFEEQTRFSSYGTDLQWEVLAFGSNASLTTEEPTFIRQ